MERLRTGHRKYAPRPSALEVALKLVTKKIELSRTKALGAYFDDPRQDINFDFLAENEQHSVLLEEFRRLSELGKEDNLAGELSPSALQARVDVRESEEGRRKEMSRDHVQLEVRDWLRGGPRVELPQSHASLGGRLHAAWSSEDLATGRSQSERMATPPGIASWVRGEDEIAELCETMDGRWRALMRMPPGLFEELKDLRGELMRARKARFWINAMYRIEGEVEKMARAEASQLLASTESVWRGCARQPLVLAPGIRGNRLESMRMGLREAMLRYQLDMLRYRAAVESDNNERSAMQAVYDWLIGIAWDLKVVNITIL
ncbi:unnamed protein product [Ostreobium quekettii]|uniref:Uncharacterized protein n=1 Tax=Ostreobium quekettii TaxID=121088 RepID=A0A8S1J397_9CHLO|nr:unnamed protein product [Ostreobium quekettii]